MSSSSSSSSSDPAIKLFGKTIALPLPTQDGGGDSGDDNKGYPSKEEITTGTEITKGRKQSDEKDVDPVTPPVDETPKKHSSNNQETAASEEKDPKNTEDDQNDSLANAQEKQQLKKPDKILPCPRCNSMDTKFCYYNNYNVNQPRHFCKKCQRYWTAGGTMRNVPVAAGRRKCKNAAAAGTDYHHLTITDAAAFQAITPDSIHHPALNPNGTVLSFGSDTPLCESMDSVRNLTEKTLKNCYRNGYGGIDEQMEEQSTGSSVTALDSTEERNGANLHKPTTLNSQVFVPHVPYVSGTSSPWSYQWAPPPTPPTALGTIAPFCASSFPVPIYPAAAVYRGCSTWSIPWIAPMPSTSPTSGCGPNSPTLGKHSRDGEVLRRGDNFKQSNQEKNLWFPTTLRIDDPEEALKSSIWATMGFNNDDKPDTINRRKGGGIFKEFQNSKTEHNNHRRVEANSQMSHANPAALSRSVNFNESS